MAIVGLSLRVLLVTVFVWSSMTKLRPAGFRAVTSMLQQIGVGRQRVFVASSLVGAEVTTAALLATPATTRAGTIAALLLLAVLTGGVAIVLHRRLDVRCACFGAHTARLSSIHLLRNGLLLACAAVACFATFSAPAGPFESGVRMSIVAVMIGLLGVVTGLNLFLLFGVIRRLREMTAGMESQESGLPEIGSTIGEFTEYTTDGIPLNEEQFATGRSLVIMLSPSCQPCWETVSLLAEHRDPFPVGTYIFVQAGTDERKLAAMLDAVRGIGTVAVLSATGTTQSAFGVSGFPATIMVDDGHVAFASFALADALPLMREKMLSR